MCVCVCVCVCGGGSRHACKHDAVLERIQDAVSLTSFDVSKKWTPIVVRIVWSASYI